MSLAAPAGAQGPPVAAVQGQPLFGFPLPAHIEGASREGITDFESRQPGTGYGIGYRRPGWTIDIFIYDLRQPPVPENPMSATIRGELARTKNEVFAAAQQGLYRNVTAKEDYAINDSTGRPRFICSVIGLFHVARNAEYDSYLCVGGWNGKFVKFRMSTPRSEASFAASRRFVAGWLPVLWPRS